MGKNQAVKINETEAPNAEPVTIKRIAEIAGVSIGTVDRALNNRGRISQETKERIQAIARDLNYHKNDLARALRVRKEIRILAIYNSKPEDYSVHFTRGFNEVVEELADYGLKFEILKTNTLAPRDFMAIIGQIDIEKYDGILINAGGPELNQFIRNALDKNVAVATFNSDSPTSDRLFFCGEDHYHAGRMCGELAAKFLQGKGTISFFSGLSTVYALRKRTEGFLDVISQEYPEIRVVNTFFHDDDPETIFQHAENLLRNSPLSDAIFCNSATGAYPICKLLEQAHIDKKPIVIGYDEGPQLVEMLKKNICTALVFQNPKLQAENALRYMFKHLYSGEAIPAKKEAIIIPTIVLKENVEIMSY